MAILDETLRHLPDCGCCAGIGPSVPLAVTNRPGLSAIAYRSGTWFDFKETLLADLRESAHPALAGLTTRADDDWTIAFLDAVAAVGDVLTFYGERIANETYLRTATERRSIVELARLIGYQPGPGVAAETLLAFTVEDAPGSSGTATIDVGLKIQSVPGHEEKPQTFETVEALEARAEWNVLRPKRTIAGVWLPNLWLQGTSTGLAPGDWLLLEGAIATDPNDWTVRRVVSATPDFDAQRTLVVLAAIGGGGASLGGGVVVVGPNLGGGVVVSPGVGGGGVIGPIDPGGGVVVSPGVGGGVIGPIGPGGGGIDVGPIVVQPGGGVIGPIGPDPDPIMPGGGVLGGGVVTNPGGGVLGGVVTQPGGGLGGGVLGGGVVTQPGGGLGGGVLGGGVVTQPGGGLGGGVLGGVVRGPGRTLASDASADPTAFGPADAAAPPGPVVAPGGSPGTVVTGIGPSTLGVTAPGASPRVFAFRTRASAFGHNAAEWKALSKEFKLNYAGGTTPPGEWPGLDNLYAPATPTVSTTNATIDLDGAIPGILPGQRALLAVAGTISRFDVTAAVAAARAEFGLAGKTTRITLAGSNFPAFKGAIRNLTAYAQSEELAVVETPIWPPVLGMVSSIILDANVGDLPAPRTLLVKGIEAVTGQPASEPVTLDRVEAAGATSRLVLATALSRAYALDGLEIFANVARATHGETVSEVLGAGSAAKPYQRFALRQPPLTFVRDEDAASGTASTLEVRVNDLRWQAVPSFYERDPNERIYATRQADDGTTIVEFGDGRHGARLPTGQENIRARYRKGTGVAGNVRAGQLTTLLTKPLGLKSAVNPEPAVGGDDPEAAADARTNAPLTVLTLDRVVSLQDYEDFARAYAGIAKALATWTWDGERRGVFVTVAGPDGTPVAADVVELLLGAIRAAGDPYVPLRVGTYRARTFELDYKVKVDPAYERPTVLVALDAAIGAAFGFEARAFGQAVSLSEVVAAIQGVAGVVAVDVDVLRRTDLVGGDGRQRPLPAALPQADSLAGTQAAELLTRSDAAIEPGVMA